MISRYFELSSEYSYILVGPRQTGKSLYIKSLSAPNAWTVNLLLSRSFLKYEREPFLFREEALFQIQKRGVKTIVVDEIQKVPLLLDEVHQLLEETDCRFLLTGSSARKLKKGAANLLGGRAIFKRIYPFTYLELDRAKMSFSGLDELLQFGTIAGIFVKPTASRPSFLRTYVDTYLKEEIQIEGLVRGLSGFAHFLEVAAQSVGEVVNYSKVGRDCSQNSNTVKNYFEILEDTLVGYRLPAWSESRRKQLASHPKFYFFDTGVVCALSSRLVDPLDAPLRGRLFEQWLINEVRAISEYQEKDCSLHYWRTQEGDEVDLLVCRGKKPLFAAEIKAHSEVKTEHFVGLKELRQDYPDLPLLLVCLVTEPYLSDGIQVLPWTEFLTQIKELIN